ncbi:NYN domain-containing protein [Methylopila henanensis]|uniref:NYN domain-containing protein n=1 Tax=Methylopila henanensis TaxID=873516 RepID=A0ABW4KAD3_9HYPH
MTRPADGAADRAPTLAVLIDGDNVSPKVIEGLLAEVATYGASGVRRVYGDWTSPNLKGWKACLLEHSLQPIQQFAYTTGKGATDGAMIIDAMDLLYTGRFDGFCLVSSDSDFVRLAQRIREQAVPVYGFGERKTPRPFITACDKFVYFDVLGAPAEAPDEARPAPASRRAIDDAGKALLRAAAAAVADESGWANLSAVGSRIAKQAPDFDPRNYGFSRLSDLVEAAGLFEVDRSEQRQKGVHLRLKSANAASGRSGGRRP